MLCRIRAVVCVASFFRTASSIADSIRLTSLQVGDLRLQARPDHLLAGPAETLLLRGDHHDELVSTAGQLFQLLLGLAQRDARRGLHGRGELGDESCIDPVRRG
jgi:hypothetical protein